MTGYELSRNWFDFCFENPEKISPNHTAIFFFAVEHCNRMGWKKKFSFPTTMAKDAVGIKSYNTYIKCFNELIQWGFIELIQKSENQYSSNIIALSNFDKSPNKSHDKSLDKAMINHVTNQSEITAQTNDSIDKQQTLKHYNLKPDNDEQGNSSPTPSIPPYVGNGQSGTNHTGAENFGDIAPGEMLIPSSIKICHKLYLDSEYFAPTREQVAMRHYMSEDLLSDWVGVFVVNLTSQGHLTKTLKDFASHFSNWLPKQDLKKTPKQALDYEQQNSNTGKPGIKSSRASPESFYNKIKSAGNNQ